MRALSDRVAVAALAILVTAFRLPALLDAGAVNSDAAVVGLQGRHMLHGEWAWHLWGTDYQGAFDSLLAGLFLALSGQRPVGLFLGAFVGILAMVAFSYTTLRKHVGAASAAIAVMPLVFAPMASNLPMVYVMRQSLATTLTVGVWLLAVRRKWWLAAAAFAFCLYIDFFAMVLLPGVAVLALACVLEEDRLWRLARSKPVLVGASIVAAVVLGVVALRLVPLSRIAGNARLLATTCIPFAFGTKVFVKGDALVAQPWDAPLPIVLLQTIGALVFGVSLLSSAVLLFRKSIPWGVRRLGLFAIVIGLTTIAAFLVSTKPVDMWSSRYLAPIFWTSPFALAPLAFVVEPARLAAAQATYWATALIGGWLSYGPFVDGPRIVITDRARGDDERTLRAALIEAGIHEAEAQYWLAYRLTFLYDEDPLVVPFERKGERYPPYRRRVDAASTHALLFHPSEPRAVPEPYEAELRAKGTAYERREIAGFTALIVHGAP